MLVTIRGVVRDGKVELPNSYWPDGTEVVVVAQQTFLSLEEQIQRFNDMPLTEWQAQFDAYIKFADEHPAEEDIDSISDEELLAIVHEVREQRR